MDILSFVGTKLRKLNSNNSVTKYQIDFKEFPIYFTDSVDSNAFRFFITNNWADNTGIALSTVYYKYFLGDIQYSLL